jgi:N-methylhydantoinase A
MESEGFARDDIVLQRTADLRFHGQAYELTLPMPDRALTEDDAPAIFDDFLAHYERTYGEGTAWKGVPASLINYSVTVIGRGNRPTLNGAPGRNGGGAPPVREEREVFLPAERRRERIPVLDDASFAIGARVEGPAIIDEGDTTVYVPPGTHAARDEYGNYVLTR